MAVNKLLPFANGVGSNVVDYATWSALSQILGQGFVTGVARSDYANRLFSQGALASYVLGQFVVDQTAQDADLNESVFYTNFKNALVSYIKANAVSLDTAQTVGGVKTFTSIPLVPTADAADSSQKVASTAFVQGEIASKADDSEVVKVTAQTLTDAQKAQARANIAPSKETLTLEYVTNALVTQSQFERIGARRKGALISVQINMTPEAGQTTTDPVVIGKIKNCTLYTAGSTSIDVVTAQDGHRWLLGFTNTSDGDVNITLYSVGTSTASRIGINKVFISSNTN